MPLISIIIPAFNEEEFLPRCLESIQALDYPKNRFEVIVVDNGSTDRTREIAASYGAAVLRNDTKTVSGLRNLGAEHASGDILAFVDADCVVAPDWLLNAEKYFDDPSVAAWGGPPEPPEDSTWVQSAWFVVRKRPMDVQAVDWLESMNLFVRKTLFDKAGGFDESLVTCEDVDLCYRLSAYGQIISDSSIEVVHLGEAATIREFFRKEVWRGQGNFNGLFRHGFSLKELPSLAIPLYFGIFMPIAFAWALIHASISYIFLAVALLLLPGAAALVKTRRKDADFPTRLQLFFLIYVYFIARTFSFFLNFFRPNDSTSPRVPHG